MRHGVLVSVGSAAPARRRAISSSWCWRAIRRPCARGCALGDEALALEQRLARHRWLRSSDVSRRARAASLVNASTRARPTPWRANSGSTNSMSISSAPLRLAKPAISPSIDGDQRQHAREAGREGCLVVGARRPRLALVGVVVFRRELLDAGAKDLRAAFGVGGDIGTQRNGAHRLNSQVAPSLPSFTATPSAASSSRRRSDATQSRRAAPRCARPPASRFRRAAPAAPRDLAARRGS